MSIPLSPRTVVTGAASGLGRAFCLRLARRGARLIVSDIAHDRAVETAELARAAGAAEVHVVDCDVTQLSQVQALERAAQELLGGVDVIVNNAGVGIGGDVGTVPIEDWQWAVNINLWGVIYGCHVFVPALRAQGHGHVINVASAAGLLCAGQMGPYNVTKAGVVALSETLASELHAAGTKVGVTVLCPTFFPTNILKSSRTHSAEGQKMAERLMEKSKLSAEDVADSALRSADRNEIHCVPMTDGLWLWRLKRLMPQAFHMGLITAGSRLLKKVSR